MRRLNACKSCAHRAVLRMVGVALGAPVSDDLLFDITQSDPLHLAKIINAHHVHTVLASIRGRDDRLDKALPEDLWIYLEEMQTANEHRRHDGIAQLSWLGSLLGKQGIPTVVLKGGAGFLDRATTWSAWRFVSDLDILVPEDKADDAQTLIAEAGGVWEPYSEHTASAQHHLPPLILANWEFQVEVHKRPGQSLVTQVLSSNDVFATAEMTCAQGIMKPSLLHRYLHHILHVAVGLNNGEMIHLRGVCDHAGFQARLTNDEMIAARLALVSAGLDHYRRRLDALCGLLVDDEVLIEQMEVRWLTHALHRFGNPSAKRYAIIRNRLAVYARLFLKQPNYRKYFFHSLRRRGKLRGVVSRLREQLRFTS